MFVKTSMRTPVTNNIAIIQFIQLEGLLQLISLLSGQPLALMCAELFALVRLHA
jgi:hypothetical protein